MKVALINVACGLIAAWIIHRINSRRKFKGLPRIGIDPGFLGLRMQAAKDEFYQKAQPLLDEGYDKHKDTPYIIQTCDNERLVVPEKFINELKNLPEDSISFKEELLGRFMGKYTKLDAVRDTYVHKDIVRIQLTKGLDGKNILPQMLEEGDLGLTRALQGCNSKEYISVNVPNLVFSAISHMTSRRVVDEPSVSRDPQWLKVITEFTASVAIFSMTMRTYPTILQPIVRYLLKCGRKLNSDITQVRTALLPEIRKREQAIADGEADQYQDFVTWLLESKKTPSDADAEVIVMRILFLIVAAMHTSAITAIHVLYDMCADPEFMEELRAEAIQEIGANGWSNASLLRLHKMESFLKESGRNNSAGLVSFQRFILKDITLSNGFKIPAGTHICAASDARSRDPAIYDSPSEFQPLRFYDKLASQGSSIDSSSLFSSVAAGDSWFGFGRQACPGRWYASAQIKIVLCLLLINYDFKYPEGQTKRPKNWMKDEKTGPDMGQMILIKKREV